MATETDYFKARYIFHNMEVGGFAIYDYEEGLKVRASLATVVNRNKTVLKLFKSKATADKKEIKIWRKI